MILVLWCLSLLAVFAVSLGYGARQKLALTGRLNDKERFSYLLDAGITKALAVLERWRKESPQTFAALNSPWSDDPEEFRDVSLGEGDFSISYDYWDEPSGTFKTRYGLVDEESKVNINKVDRPVLERLFRIVVGVDETQAQELAACIIDWRDADSQLSIPLGSAEDDYYKSLPFPYGAKNADFQVLNELLLVKGMTPEIFSRLRDYITIYGDGRVNINTASKAVLLATGLSDDIVEKILTYRQGNDKVAGTADDNIFDVPAGIVAVLSQAYDLSESQAAAISAVVQPRLGTNANYFMIHVHARLPHKKYRAHAACVVNRQGKILFWQEQEG